MGRPYVLFLYRAALGNEVRFRRVELPTSFSQSNRGFRLFPRAESFKGRVKREVPRNIFRVIGFVTAISSSDSDGRIVR